MVIHPSTNRAQRIVTSLIHLMPLTLCQMTRDHMPFLLSKQWKELNAPTLPGKIIDHLIIHHLAPDIAVLWPRVSNSSPVSLGFKSQALVLALISRSKFKVTLLIWEKLTRSWSQGTCLGSKFRDKDLIHLLSWPSG